jgi:hypothetical protein
MSSKRHRPRSISSITQGSTIRYRRALKTGGKRFATISIYRLRAALNRVRPLVFLSYDRDCPRNFTLSMLQTGLRVGEVAALSIAKIAPQRAHLSQSRQHPVLPHPLQIEGQPFSDPPPRPAARPGLCRLGTRKPLLHSSPVACRPPLRRSRNPAYARKRSPSCKSRLKTCLVLCDFGIKTVRGQNWWAA